MYYEGAHCGRCGSDRGFSTSVGCCLSCTPGKCDHCDKQRAKNEPPTPKVTRVEYLTYANNGDRLVRLTNDTIASLIKNFAIKTKSWVLRTNIEYTSGMKEFWTPHGLVRVESVVSERKCFELKEGV